jgi:voltage-gated sodium channel
MSSTPVVPLETTSVLPVDTSEKNAVFDAAAKAKNSSSAGSVAPSVAWGNAAANENSNLENGKEYGGAVSSAYSSDALVYPTADPADPGQAQRHSKIYESAGKPVLDAMSTMTSAMTKATIAGVGNGGLFEYANSEVIKKNVRETLLRPDPYTVFNFYHADGIFQRIAKHELFENVTLGVIAGNAVWMAIDTDWNKEKSLTSSAAIFQVAEHLFCTYFSVEWFIRFMAFKRKLDGLKDAWFVFDSILVAMMVMETWVFIIIAEINGNKGESPLGDAAVLRLFRLLRLSRLLRMLRSLPELMILIKGMKTAMKTVLWVMCLLVIILYVFAIALTQLAMDKDHIKQEYFFNVALAMYSLLIYGTFLDDLSQFCNDIRKESIPCLVLVFIFIALSALTVMNMLIGVLCEVVSAVAKTEKEMIHTANVKDKMQGIVNNLDTNEDGKINFLEFQKILQLPEALRALEDVGVDPAGVVDFAELMFFEDSDPDKPLELPFETFMEMILDLRCSNVATVRDVKYLWRQINPKVSHLTQELGDLKERTDRIETSVDSVLGEVKKLINRQDALTGEML